MMGPGSPHASPTSPAPSNRGRIRPSDSLNQRMLFEALSRAGRDAGERRVGQVDWKVRFRVHELGEATKERAAPHEDDSTVRYVGGKLGRGCFERLLNRVKDLAYGPLKGFPRLLSGEADPPQASRDEISAAHFRLRESAHVYRGSHFDLRLLGT